MKRRHYIYTFKFVNVFADFLFVLCLISSGYERLIARR
nr:MAG TPA_asm: hypothetical protein [Caudoviricetes sp.]